MVIETGFSCIPTIKESGEGEKGSACLIFWLSGWELIFFGGGGGGCSFERLDACPRKFVVKYT